MLGILPFEAVAVSAADAAAVYNFIESRFLATGVYTVITSEQRDQILGSPNAAGCTKEDCALEIARKIAADQIVVGIVARSEGRTIVNARIIATDTRRTLAADSISAADAQDLERVCNTLVVSLTRRAVPGSLAEEEEKPGAEQPALTSPLPNAAAEGAPAEGPEGSLEGGPGISAAEGSGREPVEKLSRADLWPLVNICGGMFLLEVGNIMGSTGFELRRRISDDYVDYSEASWNLEELWKTYNSAYIGYFLTTTLSYVSWATAVASIPTYLIFFPEKAFRLSRLGTVFFATGAVLSVAGNVLDLMAGAQRYRNDFLYDDYLSAGTGFDELYDRYRRGHILYSVERLTGYGFWLLGGAGMITAFFLPGPKEEPIAGFWDKAVLSGGIALVGLGSVTRTVALNHRQTHIESGGDEKEYQRYVLNSVLSYGLWAAGAVGMFLPFVTDIGGGEREPAGEEARPVRPQKLGLLPLPGGLTVSISY